MKLNFQLTRKLRYLGTIIITATFFNYLSTHALDHNSYIEKGDHYYEQFDNVNAIKQYENAYRLSPDNFHALSKLCQAYNDLGEDLKDAKSDDAEQYFNNAIKHAEILRSKFPYMVEPYYLLASAYGNLARFKGGKDKVRYARYLVENAKKAIEIDPNFAPAYVILGIYYREVSNLNFVEKTIANSLLGGLPNGTIEESKEMLQKASELSPQSIYAHYDLAETYEKLNEKDKAIEHYKKVTDLPITDHQDIMKKEKAETRLRRLNSN